MSRSKRRVESLQQILVIRDVGKQLAEAATAAARMAVAVAQDARQSEEAALQESLAAWQKTTQSALFDPGASMLWGRQVNAKVADIAAAEAAERDRNEELEVAESHWAKAIASGRCSETLLTKARRARSIEIENRTSDERADAATRASLR
jgi:hypothetical protein